MKRGAVIAAFVVLALSVGAAAARSVDHAVTGSGARPWLVAMYSLLRLVIALAFVAFVFTRRPARRSIRDPLALAACAGAIIPVVLLSQPSVTGPASRIIAGELVTLAACMWMLVAVLALGKSFSVLPEARALVTDGPYRWVRHPVYLGELGAFTGLVIASLTARNLIAGVIFTVAQTARMRFEERALTEEFPSYAHYAARTPLLIPRPTSTISRPAQEGEHA
jgi:protein-S-isoprenylcysteine O-methyltransferase Ste14